MSEYKSKSKQIKEINKKNEIFNLELFKNKVFEKLDLQVKNELDIDIKTEKNLRLEYFNEYKDYMDRVFNDRLLMIINRMIMDSNLNMTHMRNNFPIHKILLGVTKKFMLNEIELIHLSLYLDKLGWNNINYTLEEYLSYLAFTTKIYLNSNLNSLTSYIKTIDPLFESKYVEFNNNEDLINDSLLITPRDFNKRHSDLTRPANIFCRYNFLDLNYIVDEIISMSLPYSEVKKEKLITNEDDSQNNFHLKIGNKSIDNNNLFSNNPFLSYSESNLNDNSKVFLNKKSKKKVLQNESQAIPVKERVKVKENKSNNMDEETLFDIKYNISNLSQITSKSNNQIEGNMLIKSNLINHYDNDLLQYGKLNSDFYSGFKNSQVHNSKAILDEPDFNILKNNSFTSLDFPIQKTSNLNFLQQQGSNIFQNSSNLGGNIINEEKNEVIIDNENEVYKRIFKKRKENKIESQSSIQKGSIFK